jgi:hypothetical protein
MQTITLEEYSRLAAEETAMIEGMAKGKDV